MTELNGSKLLHKIEWMSDRLAECSWCKKEGNCDKKQLKENYLKDWICEDYE